MSNGSYSLDSGQKPVSLAFFWFPQMSPTAIKFVIAACLIGIVVSLGTGLFHLVSDRGESKKMVSALTLRIALSVILFLFLLLAWGMGWLQPHGMGR
jgi:succinate dehydrogenase/fumarate reductase cytochrome b subunit